MSRGFSFSTATAVVVANMVGTGIFTSLGFQLLDIRSPFVLMMLWLIGGITALCGALCYAELATRLPRSGGEYNFLSQTYHPIAGFVSGWISTTIGFAAPTALAAMTFSAYLSATIPGLPKTAVAVTLVVVLTSLHCISRNTSGGMQQVMTAVKLLLIVTFCLLVWLFGSNPQTLSLLPTSDDSSAVFSGAFAIALIYVNYAYTGWNAATYLTSEIEDPQRNLPRVLITGTTLVMCLYLLLNFIFLYGAPMDLMEGKIEIGIVVAEQAFGENGGRIMGGLLSLMLISTVSAMVMAGPRVLQVIGEDFRIFRFLAAVRDGVPVRAILFQSALTIIFIITATFESILVFSGFVLGINTLFAVAGIFVLRYRHIGEQSLYRTFAYPLTPIVYLSITLWTLTYILINKPLEGLVGLALICAGVLMYFVSRGFGITPSSVEREISSNQP
ncbi:MAG: APA family basic amino acid/polyamine antiporter [Halieaceae bacterium]